MVVVLIGEKLETLPTFIPEKVEADAIIMSPDVNSHLLKKAKEIVQKAIILLNLDQINDSYDVALLRCKESFPDCYIWGYAADANPSKKAKLIASGFDKAFNSDDNPAQSIKTMLNGK